MKTRALPSLATALAAGLVMAGTALPAEAAAASSALVRTPATVTAAPDGSRVNVTVRYRCTNNSRYTHYLTGLVEQVGADSMPVNYVVGFRSDNGGTLRATCTGKTVTKVLRLKPSSYNIDPEQTIEKGAASLSVSLERRNATGYGAGYYNVVSTKSAERAVTVR